MVSSSALATWQGRARRLLAQLQAFVDRHWVLLLIKRTVQEFGADRASLLATNIAYSALFSVFPLLLGAVALASLVLNRPGFQDQLTAAAVSYLPGSGDFIQQTLQGVIAARGATGLVAALLLIWSGKAVFGAIIEALNVIWKVPPTRNLIVGLLVPVALIFAVGLLFVISMFATSALQVLTNISVPVLGIQPFSNPVWSALLGLVPLAASVGIFFVLYRYAPDTGVPWREALFGAVVAGALFELAKNLFVWYIRGFTNFNVVYGSVGVVIVLLTWAYFSALILLLGAEVGSEYGRLQRGLPRGA